MRSGAGHRQRAAWARLIGLAAAILVVVIGAGASPVAAHTDLESSTPAAGETVTTPVSEVTLVWSGPVAPIDGGFEVTDPQGAVRPPSSLTVADGSTLVLGFDPPLAGGVVELRWSVTGADGHVIDGVVAFTVDAPLPTTTTVPPTTTTAVPTTTAATTTTAAVTTTTRPETTVPATTAPATTAPATTDVTVPPPAEDASGGGSGAGPILATLAVIAAAGAAITYAVLRERRRRSGGEAVEPV